LGQQVPWAPAPTSRGPRAASHSAAFRAPYMASPFAPTVAGACAEKRTICRFWKEGHCKDGEQCTWAHGEHELGQQVPWAPAPTSRAAQRASPYPTAQHQSGAGLYKALPASLAAGFSAGFSGGYAAGPVRRAPLALAGGGQAGPAGAAPRRTVCRFWLEGFCKDGAQCTWAHGEHEIGTMPGAPETAGLASTKRTICKFFQDGFCERGSSCGFAHGAHEIGQPVPGANGYGVQRPSAVNFFAEPAGPVTTKRTLCKFFQDGHCKSGSACGFAHGAHEIGQAVPGASGYGVQWPSAVKAAPPATRRTMCRFNEQGRCERGDSCTFAHHEWQLGTPILQ